MAQLNVNFMKTVAEFEAVMKKQMLLKTVFYKRLFGGRGMEFDSFRNYSEEDDASLIDWKATARAKRPLVRQYVDERDVKIFVLIDSGDNMVFGSGNKIKLERSAEIAACITHLIISSGDSVGYAMYSNKINFMKPLGGGKKQFYGLIDALSNMDNYGNFSSLKNSLDFIAPRLKGVNAVFIISDFTGMDNESIKTLKKFARKYETIGVMVRDLVDDRMPNIKNEIAIEDPRTGEQVVINPSVIKERYSEITKDMKSGIRESFKKAGVTLFENYTHEDFILPFAKFLRRRVKKGGSK